MSPAEIRTLLHIYAIPLPMENEGCCPLLKSSGLIIESSENSGWDVTERGSAMVHMLMDTPLPQGGFVDPRTMEVVRK